MPVPADWSKLSDVVKKGVVKKDVYGKLAANANGIDTTGIILKPEDDTDKSEVENKIPDNNGLLKNRLWC